MLSFSMSSHFYLSLKLGSVVQKWAYCNRELGTWPLFWISLWSRTVLLFVTDNRWTHYQLFTIKNIHFVQSSVGSANLKTQLFLIMKVVKPVSVHGEENFWTMLITQATILCCLLPLKLFLIIFLINEYITVIVKKWPTILSSLHADNKWIPLETSNSTSSNVST